MASVNGLKSKRLQGVEPTILFGGGRNTRSREADIHPQECSDGENFSLTLANSTWRNRAPFDLAGTAPNAGDIRGWAQVQKADGTLSTLIQAGGNVYEWDGNSTWTLQGTCHSSSRLRGRLDANFILNDEVIITDLEKLTVVKTWDGTSYANLGHNLGTDFYAKHCTVANERALFANVKTTTDTPHVLVGSQRGDDTQLTVTNRPSTSLSAEDPFFIPIQDLKPMNGLLQAFGLVIFSTSNGSLWKMSGSDAQDFAIEPFYIDSSPNSDEAIVLTGNDVFIGRDGAIDSLRGVDAFGDVKTDDPSRWISPDIEEVTDWMLAHDRRLKKTYCFPSGIGECHVFHHDMEASELSPWSKYTTVHSMDMRPTTVWGMKRPTDGIFVIYMGDDSGNVYQFEGSGGQDGGSDDVTSFRVSPLIKGPNDTIHRMEGWVDYKKNAEQTLSLVFQHGGSNVFDQEITLTLPERNPPVVYGGAFYYGGSSYYGQRFKARLYRQDFNVAGRSSQVQIKTSITGSSDFTVDQIKLQFLSA